MAIDSSILNKKLSTIDTNDLHHDEEKERKKESSEKNHKIIRINWIDKWFDIFRFKYTHTYESHSFYKRQQKKDKLNCFIPWEWKAKEKKTLRKLMWQR